MKLMPYTDTIELAALQVALKHNMKGFNNPEDWQKFMDFVYDINLFTNDLTGVLDVIFTKGDWKKLSKCDMEEIAIRISDWMMDLRMVKA